MTENENQQRQRLKLTKNYYNPAAEAGHASPPGQNNESSVLSALQYRPAHVRRDSSRLRQRRLLVAFGWIFFIILAAFLLYLRFFSSIPGLTPDTIRRYGMIAVGTVYLVCIFLALKDNMFDGLLAIIVPFYPFYYLFFNSGSIFMRALAAAFLAAFGFDCLVSLQHLAMKTIDRISYWIAHV